MSSDFPPERPAAISNRPSVGKAEITMLADGGCRRLARLNMENFNQDGSNLAFGSTPALRAQGADGQRSERLRAEQLRTLLNSAQATRHHAASTENGQRTVLKLGEVINQATHSGQAVNFFSEVSFTPLRALQRPGLDVAVRAHEPDLLVTYQHERAFQTLMARTGQAPVTSHEVLPDGTLRAISPDDRRLQLRVIDLKASAETSSKQLLEAGWYALTMSSWLAEHSLMNQPLPQRALVRADFGIWNGHAQTDPVPSEDLGITEALGWIHQRFVTGNSEQLLIRLLGSLEELPQLTSQSYEAQPWSLKPECDGCGFLHMSPPHGDQPAQPGGCAAEARGTTHALPAYDALLEQPARDLLHAPLRSANLSSGALKAAIGPDHMRALASQQTAQTARRAQVMSGVNPNLNLPGGSDVSLRLWLERDSATGLIGGAGMQITHFVRPPGESPLTLRWAGTSPDRSPAGEAELLRQLLEEMHRQIMSVPERLALWPNQTTEGNQEEPGKKRKAQPQHAQGSFQVYLWNEEQAEAWKSGMGRLLDALQERPDWARLIWLLPPPQAAGWPGWTGGRGLSVLAPELNRMIALPETSRTLAAYSDLTRSPEDRAVNAVARAQRRATDGQRNRSLEVSNFTPPLGEERGFHLLMRHWQMEEKPDHSGRTSTYKLEIYLHAQARLLSRVVREIQRKEGAFGLKLSLKGPRGRVADLLPGEALQGGATHALWINQNLLGEAQKRDESRVRQLRGLTLMQESGHALTLRNLRISAGENRTLVIQGLSGSENRGARVGPGGYGLSLFWRSKTADEAPRERSIQFVSQTRLNEAEDQIELTTELSAEEAASPQKIASGIQAGAVHWLAASSSQWSTSKLRRALEIIGPFPGNDVSLSRRLRDPVMATPASETEHPGLRLLHPGGDEPQNEAAFARAAARILNVAPSLTTAQSSAAQTLLSRRAGLLWGPPGTGKSQVLAAIIVCALSEGLRVLITATNYGACDTLLSRTLRQAHEAGIQLPVLARLLATGRAAGSDPQLAELTLTRHDPQWAELAQELAAGSPGLVSAPHQQAFNFISQGDEHALFDLIVVDEGSQMPASGLSLPLCGAARNATLIVAGDPLQLPAIQIPAPEGLEALCGSAYAHLGTHLSQQALDINWRSDAQIVDASRAAGYEDSLQAAHPRRALTLLPATHRDHLDWALAPERPCVLIRHHAGAHRSSQKEASVTAELATRLYERAGQPDPEAFWGRHLGVVTPHRVQAGLIVQALRGTFPTHDPDLIGTSVGTADAYQGQERQTIIVSPGVGTRAGIQSEEAFIYAPERWNVAFSRAQCKLIVLMTPALISGLPEDPASARGLRLLQHFAFRASERGPDWPLPAAPRGLRPKVGEGTPTAPSVWSWPTADSQQVKGELN